ncbi:MAG TPA: rod shape-determining protein RodA, partial [Candidatus Limnocylindria bacterium]|nr:rod shape-determining protein RodA [Candidatus Limnocylindria bacterium]
MTAQAIGARGRASSRTARNARTGVKRERHHVSWPLLTAVLALAAIGVVMVYSASSVRAYLAGGDP